MKKYAIAASLFLFNNEIVTLLAFLIIMVIAITEFAKAAEREARER